MITHNSEIILLVWSLVWSIFDSFFHYNAEQCRPFQLPCTHTVKYVTLPTS